MIFKIQIDDGITSTLLARECERMIYAAFYIVCDRSVYINVLYSDGGNDIITDSILDIRNRNLYDCGWVKIPPVHTEETEVEITPEFPPVRTEYTVSMDTEPTGTCSADTHAYTGRDTTRDFSSPFIEIRRNPDGTIHIPHPWE